MNTKFEYTGKANPQRDHQAKVGFYTIEGRAQSMISNANVTLKTRYKMCKEALQTATFLDGLTVMTRDGETVTLCKHWMGSIPNFAPKLSMWGEAVVVK